MKARFVQSQHTYTGFLNDLNVADESLSRQGGSAVAAEIATFSKMVRYGLLRSSVASLSVDLPPKLLLQAVRQGLWTPQRAFAFASACPEAPRSAHSFS